MLSTAIKQILNLQFPEKITPTRIDNHHCAILSPSCGNDVQLHHFFLPLLSLPLRLRGPNLSGSRAHSTVILLFFLCDFMRLEMVCGAGFGTKAKVQVLKWRPPHLWPPTHQIIRYSTIDMEDSAESTVNPISQGCGPHPHISIHISPTTGGDFYLTVEPDITVENLKKLVSKKLKVPRDRICLLFRDKWVIVRFGGYCRVTMCNCCRQLQDGSILQHGVADGSKVTLLPNVETGLVVSLTFFLHNKKNIVWILYDFGNNIAFVFGCH